MKGKSKKLFMLSILALAMALCPFMGSRVKAITTKIDRVSLTKSNGDESKYEKLQEAINAADNGSKIKIISTNGYGVENTVEISNKTLTIDFARQNFGTKIKVTNKSNVTFLSGINRAYYLNHIFEIEDSTVTFDGGVYNFGNNEKIIELDSNSTLNFDNGVYFRITKVPVLVKGSNSTVNVKRADLNGSNAIEIADSAQNNHIILSSDGTIGKDSGDIGIKDAGKNTTIDLYGPIKRRIDLQGTGSVVNLNSGASVVISSEWAVKIAGENNTINFNGATIEGGYGGVLIDSPTTTVNVENSTIKGTGRHNVTNLISPAIVAKNVKDLNIKSGTITGELGVVAYNGNVNISGGNISATNDNGTIFEVFETNKISLGQYQANNGAAVIIDNKDGVNTNAKANITGGNFIAKSEKSIISAGDKATDYAVSGGIYDKPFDEKFIVPNKLELTLIIDDEQKWYVGQDAVDAVEKAKKDSKNKIEILQGDITIENAAEGLSVKNSGKGSVKVNETTVETNQTVIAPKVPEKPTQPEPSNPDINGGQEDVPNTGDVVTSENPQTGDKIIAYIIMGTLSLLGLAGITTKRLILNKR